MHSESPLLPNLHPSSSLDVYRKQASFSWKHLVTLIDEEKVIELRMKMYDFLSSDPLFKQRQFPSSDEKRKITTIRIHKIIKWILAEGIIHEGKLMTEVVAVFGQYDPSIQMKFVMSFLVYNVFILSQGNDIQRENYLAFPNSNVCGSFALTEIGHGSNTKCMKTQAKFDPETQEFVLNSRNFEAAKCLVGSLGKCATHSIIWARLISPDGADHGPHSFVVKIRHPQTGLPYPGVIVGDMGRKAGHNGIDNGFVLFENYRIPKLALLTKIGDITPDGAYITLAKSSKERFNASFDSLTRTRFNIAYICSAFLTNAVTIGVRYAAVRKQFGPSKKELPIIEYQLTQYRLFPYLAAIYCLRMCLNQCTEVESLESKHKKHNESEFHAFASSIKGLASWLSRDGIQECREVCGGHGYLNISGLADLRNDNDATSTYEGDNHILLQQTSNWLMQIWTRRYDEETKALLSSLTNSVSFLLQGDDILKTKFQAETINELVYPETLLKAYKWLICYMLEITTKKFHNLQNEHDEFISKTKCQVFYAKTLSIVYAEHFVISVCYQTIMERTSSCMEIQNVLHQLLSLYGTWSLEKHLSYLYQGGYVSEGSSSTLFKTGVLDLCARLKPEVVSLVDAIAPPDFILNSVLGCADDKVYEHMRKTLFKDPETFKRAEWWPEVIPSLKAKL